MSDTPSWYTQGYSGIKNEEDRIADKYGPDRFWMKAGNKTQIVFVDDVPACIHEHGAKINDSWKNWFTCQRDVNPDDVVCCELLGADTRSYVGYFTIVDCTQWKDKKGNIHEFEIKLFPAKLKTLKLLQGKKEDREDRLAGRVYKVQRTDDSSPGVGNDFEFDRDADIEKLLTKVNYKGKKLVELMRTEKPDDLIRLMNVFSLKVREGVVGSANPSMLIPTFNYLEILKPKSPKELRTVLRGARIEKRNGSSTGSSSDDSSNKSDDPVPF